jgi:hypothetical protein
MCDENVPKSTFNHLQFDHHLFDSFANLILHKFRGSSLHIIKSKALTQSIYVREISAWHGVFNLIFVYINYRK